MATITTKYDDAGKPISYKFTCCVGRDDNGKQVWRTKTVKSPHYTEAKEKKWINTELLNWEQQQKDDYKKSHNTADKDRITFAEFVREHWWPDHVMDGSHTPSSVSFYKHMSDNILEYFGSKKKLSQIDAETVKRYIKYLRTDAVSKSGKPYSAATIQHHFSTLRNILEYARRFHYIQSDPCHDLTQKEKPHRDKKKIDFLSIQQAQRFMECLQNEPLFWRCFMTVLLKTGLRRGECVALQWGDIDGNKLELHITRNVTIDRNSPDKICVGKTKTDEERTVPISQGLYALLMTHKHEQQKKHGVLFPNAFVFCSASDPYKPIYPTEPTRWQSKFVKRNDLPQVSPHDLRHTAATLALESGADLKQVQELLGHRDPSTTMAFYTGVTEEAQRRTIEGIESLIG
ncbi:site-specific integrase [Selenomonas ruminantium]|uniref:tyrosine-type recombinase/integrase n=1 Tax=Selenomonas ruminantium TaxID=971 RepID=UPI00156A3168|nr:site-specific integrase [Selenomonas ruminantium]